MDPRVILIDKDIFTVSAVFTPLECEELIAKGEDIGFEAASVTTSSGPQMMTNVRNNDRVIMEDVSFAHSVWERVRSIVPQEIEGGAVRGLNERFRFYRYDPGQRFKRHVDGSVENAYGDKSRLTFLIYLNDGYEGGETIFSDYTFEGGKSVIHETRVASAIGMGLFFVHERKHEGAPVTSGRKYVLRTDVMYGNAQR